MRHGGAAGEPKILQRGSVRESEPRQTEPDIPRKRHATFIIVDGWSHSEVWEKGRKRTFFWGPSPVGDYMFRDIWSHPIRPGRGVYIHASSCAAAVSEPRDTLPGTPASQHFKSQKIRG